MLSRNIEAEYNRHVKNLKFIVFDDFTPRSDAEIAKLSTRGFLPREFENPINRADVFFDLIEKNYNTKFRQAVDSVKDLFAKHNLSFRLIDIPACMHGYRRMTMLWNSKGNEYVFDFFFDTSEDDPFDSFYRLGCLDSCGTPINGDILHENSRQIFEDNSDLPSWFVDGLRANS